MAKNVGIQLVVIMKKVAIVVGGLVFIYWWLHFSSFAVYGQNIPAPPFVAVTDQGRPLVGASISVTDSGGAPVTVCANAACSATISQIPAGGVFSFYQAPGTYNVTISGAGVNRTYQVNIPVASGALSNATFPTPGILRKVSSNVFTSIVVNFTASAAPTVNDDSGDGYSVGSMWVDNTGNVVYLCADATLGAAVWNATGGGSGGITQINFDTGPIVVLLTGSNGTDFGIDNPVVNNIRFHLPSMAASGVTRGVLTNTNQTLPGDKTFTGTVVAQGIFTVNDMMGAGGIFDVKTTSYSDAILSYPATDQIGFFTTAAASHNAFVVMEAPAGSNAALEVFSSTAASGIIAKSGTSSSNAVEATSIVGNTGAAIRGLSLAAGSKAGFFARSIASSTQPVVQVRRDQSSDSTALLELVDASVTVSANNIFQYILNGNTKAAIKSDGTFIGTFQPVSEATFTVLADADTGLGFTGAGELFLYADGAPVVDCDITGCAIAPLLAVNGEVAITGVAGNQKVVCVKADGKLGECSSVVGAGGTCTCA